MRIAIRLLVLLAAGGAVAVAWPRYTTETGLPCTYCHTQPDGTGPLTVSGRYYNEHLTMAGFEPAPSTAKFSVGGRLGGLFEHDFADTARNTFMVYSARLNLLYRPCRMVELMVGNNLGQMREAYVGMRALPLATSLRFGLQEIPFGLNPYDHTLLLEDEAGLGLARNDVGLSLRSGPDWLTLRAGIFNNAGAGLFARDNNLAKSFVADLSTNWRWAQVGVSGWLDRSPGRERELAEAYAYLGWRIVAATLRGRLGSFADRRVRGSEFGLELTPWRWVTLRGSYGFYDPDRDQSNTARWRSVFGVKGNLPWGIRPELLYYLNREAGVEISDDALVLMLRFFF